MSIKVEDYYPRATFQKMKAFADQILPELQQQREGAQKMFDAIKP